MTALLGTRALITGVSTTLGFRAAALLAEQGAQVILGCTSADQREPLADSVAAIRAAGGFAHVMAIAEAPDAIERLFAESVALMDGIDLVVLGAGQAGDQRGAAGRILVLSSAEAEDAPVRSLREALAPHDIGVDLITLADMDEIAGMMTLLCKQPRFSVA